MVNILGVCGLSGKYIIVVVIIFVITFTHGTYIYIPETQLFLQHTVLQLFCIYNIRNT
jgi:hypothetical protein